VNRLSMMNESADCKPATVVQWWREGGRRRAAALGSTLQGRHLRGEK